MIKYEDLLQNPEEVLSSLSDKLGLKYSAKLLEYHISSESKKTASSGEMWKNVAKPILKDNRGKYHTELTKEEILIFENIAGTYLSKLGYSLDNDIKKPKAYTDLEIQEFARLNTQLQVKARLNATEEERVLRKKQEELISNIKDRFGIYSN